MKIRCGIALYVMLEMAAERRKEKQRGERKSGQEKGKAGRRKEKQRGERKSGEEKGKAERRKEKQAGQNKEFGKERRKLHFVMPVSESQNTAAS